MAAWRVSDYDTLTGVGGTIVDGRWHHIGAPVVYQAESSALALLEVFVSLAMGTVPVEYQLLEVELPEHAGIDTYAGDRPPALERSRDWGSAWLRGGRSPLARVPSAVAPFSWNLLLNPLHPVAGEARIIGASRWPWDRRLFKDRRGN